jgi:hypothetical protein
MVEEHKGKIKKLIVKVWNLGIDNRIKQILF